MSTELQVAALVLATGLIRLGVAVLEPAIRLARVPVRRARRGVSGGTRASR